MKCILPLFLFLLAACHGPQMTPEQISQLHELADRPVMCSGEEDCDQKWNLAIKWVSDHSTMGIKTVSDRLIATNMENLRESIGYNLPEFSVVRYHSGRHAYTMEFKSYCDQLADCNPSALQLKADFVTFVVGPPPGVAMHADGQGASKVIHTHTDE